MTKSNGHDPSNVTSFPTPEERDTLERARIIRTNDNRPEPMLNLPPVVRALCLINVVVFVVGLMFPELLTDDRIYALSFVPARYTSGSLDFAAIISPLTHMFIHEGWTHLCVNVGMLMAFGAAVEKTIGGRKFLLIYLASGLMGAFLHAVAWPDGETPMIGASGAISGLFGAVIMLMYLQGMMGMGYRRLLPFVAVWVAVSIIFGILGTPGSLNPIAWVTHVGGFMTGLLLYKPVARWRLR